MENDGKNTGIPTVDSCDGGGHVKAVLLRGLHYWERYTHPVLPWAVIHPHLDMIMRQRKV
jgi:hypothetical protein